MALLYIHSAGTEPTVSINVRNKRREMTFVSYNLWNLTRKFTFLFRFFFFFCLSPNKLVTTQLLTTEPAQDRRERESHIYFLPLKYEKLQGGNLCCQQAWLFAVSQRRPITPFSNKIQVRCNAFKQCRAEGRTFPEWNVSHYILRVREQF